MVDQIVLSQRKKFWLLQEAKMQGIDVDGPKSYDSIFFSDIQVVYVRMIFFFPGICVKMIDCLKNGKCWSVLLIL